MSNGPHRGRLYFGYLDDGTDPQVNKQNTIVLVRFSDDNGLTWSSPVEVNDDVLDNHSHFFPKLAVDQFTGALGVAWYDAREDFTNRVVNVFATLSLDGGNTFLPNVQVSAGPSDGLQLPGNGANDFGDYMGLAFVRNVLVPAWADNEAALANVNPGPAKPTPLPRALDVAVGLVSINNVPILSGGGGGGGGSTPNLSDDQFEPNDSSSQPTQLGFLSGTETFSNLTINTHANGLPDNDWYGIRASQDGTFTATINYTPLDTGDLNMRLFTVNSQGLLVQLGSSLTLGTTTQTISVFVANGEPLFLWVYGFDRALATYGLTLNLA